MSMHYVDLHVHSRFSRATSKNITIDTLSKYARMKGLTILGTGDFTFPLWLSELKENLIEDGTGILKTKDGFNFIFSTEVSNIYTQDNEQRKIHNVILAPNFGVVEQINAELLKHGRLDYDGRPIFGFNCVELVEMLKNIDKNIEIIPAHCLLPDTYLHSNPGIKKIKDISIGDKIYTHEGRLKEVKQIYTRFYEGPIYNIKPYNFRIGLKTTSEHPFYIIKTYKNCKNCPHTICKPDCIYYQKRGCLHTYFKKYHPQWVQAKNIEKGDILIFPRFNGKIKHIKKIELNKYLDLNQTDYTLTEDSIKLNHSRAHLLPRKIKIDQDFCRLAGYYVSEGYTDSRDSISFCFNRNEKEYIEDLKFLMGKIFDLSSPRIYKRKNTNSIEIIYFAKILSQVFGKLFYNSSARRRADTKCLPSWMLNISLEKEVEIFKGWWRGDKGVTSSRELMNQMKIILLRLGIIPSINEQLKESFNKKHSHKHKIGDRTIKAQHDSFIFHNLSFFQDLFGLLKTIEFKKFKTKLTRRHGWIDEKYIYIPVRDIEIKNYEGEVYNLEVEGDNSYLSEFATVHNCLTPWYGIFGSKSGFDSVEECFQDQAKYIHALETGLSADPSMIHRVSNWSDYTLVSFSDSHSPWPWRIGREATVFNLKEFTYDSIVKAVRTKEGLVETFEFFPEEGKYHWDGHRNCNISLKPSEAMKLNNICPVCRKQLTIGVLHRVEELADKPEGFVPENTIPFKSLIPLSEIIATQLGTNLVYSQKVWEEYNKLIKNFGSEFNVLLNISKNELIKITRERIADAILKVRGGKIKIQAGFDGVYGKPIFGEGEESKTEIKLVYTSKQKALGDFIK